MSCDLSLFPFCGGSAGFFGEIALLGTLPEKVNLLLGDEQFAFDIDGFDHVLFAPTIPRWSRFADAGQPENKLYAATIRSGSIFRCVFHIKIVGLSNSRVPQ